MKAAGSGDVEVLLAGTAPKPGTIGLEAAGGAVFAALACDVPKLVPVNVKGAGDGVWM